MALVFSTSNATPQTYRTFIDALRLRLTAGRPTSHGIPVLPRNEDVQNAQRFLLVDLTNSENNTITVAIGCGERLRGGLCCRWSILLSCRKCYRRSASNPPLIPRHHSGSYSELQRHLQRAFAGCRRSSTTSARW
ncbi:abrin-d-like [Prunus yedoensis var. nudiflora]|uniref:rRNA N-glycosylase n=1 Tax=Prunus yedoensis var. nudiflora TaxID=2094558 RepID=A0A314ZIL1_PRUYE|nr:abrin-d-like [Prunus yedoensis var. nudiflora]